MVNYISVENISKSFGEKELFREISFGLAQGQKTALVGVNGSGKSTLLKILAGKESPDSGTVSMKNGLSVAFLSQVPDFEDTQQVKSLIYHDQIPAIRLRKEYEALTGKMSAEEVDQEAIDELLNQINALDAWNYEQRVNELLSKLQINFPEAYIGELSGGQQKRLSLALNLLDQPDILILDEPTNHLDLESIEWLENFLSHAKQSLILVTHDRYFLDAVTDEIIELDKGKLYRYQGNYAYFLEQKAHRELAEAQRLEKQQNLFRQELVWMSRSPKARGTKAKARIENFAQLSTEIDQPKDLQQVNLSLKGRRLGSQIAEWRNVSKAYGDKVLIRQFTYTFRKKDRIGIIGPNGAGKSTFLRLLTEELAPDTGRIRVGETVHFGFFRQEGLAVNPEMRVLDAVAEIGESIDMGYGPSLSPAQLLEHFLFPGHMHYARVGTLSGGERRRLHLLRVLMGNPNFLVLDEPTNDLDLMTLRQLESFLEAFEGCLAVVSHDRFFMDRLVEHLFVFDGNGGIQDFPGSYSQFREAENNKVKPEPISSAKAPSPHSPPSQKAPATESDTATKLSYKEKREFEQLEKEIEHLENKKAALTDALESGETDYEKLTALTQELEQINHVLEEKSDRWLELADRTG